MLILIGKLRPLASEKGHNGGLLTSRDLSALFTDGLFSDEDGTEYGARTGNPFHPMDLYPDCYSPNLPQVAISYTWSGMCLESHIPRFLDKLEEDIGPDRTYWMDIFFLDRNSSLDDMELPYIQARWHAVFMKSKVLCRGWVKHEIATRVRSLMDLRGLNADQLAEKIHRWDDSFPILVIVPSLTNIEDDLDIGTIDWFGNIQMFTQQDSERMQARILVKIGSQQIFNNTLLHLINATLSRHAMLNPVMQASSFHLTC